MATITRRLMQSRAGLAWASRIAEVTAIMAFALGIAASFGAAGAQDGQEWSPGITVSPSPPGDAWATENRPAAEPQQLPEASDAVQRAREALAAAAASPGVILSARLTEDGRTLNRDLTWRIYGEPQEAEAAPQLVERRDNPSPHVRLDPGTYLINVAFGRSHITRRVNVGPGPMKEETFILNAGGLRLTAYAGEQEVPDKTVTFDVFEADTDQSGQRRLVLSNARPGVIVRLNAGIYFIRSTYGEANAQVESEVSVEAGKLTEIAMAHAAAKVTLALVTRAGGEALPATQWEIATPDGDLIDRSVGALPTHILAPGSYKITATNGGRVFWKDVNLEDNQTVRVEILAQ
ncbi:MAG: hypothetical protein APF80_07160 [Alphaproteobacteria bacterium BRH_c36]|nr:MAG: hypothetical protein APF80_07160 [Alphaproteobacteria bacterium BRH_c36]